MSDVKYILYSSEGCHLCELALSLCLYTFSESDVRIVDIVDDESLVERYGVHIPVLERLSDNKALYWPFDKDQVKAHVKGLS